MRAIMFDIVIIDGPHEGQEFRVHADALKGPQPITLELPGGHPSGLKALGQVVYQPVIVSGQGFATDAGRIKYRLA